jgi:integrase
MDRPISNFTLQGDLLYCRVYHKSFHFRSGVDFPVAVKGLFRPHYVAWSEQQNFESYGPLHLRNIVRIITETGLRIYKELTPMRKDQVDLQNAVVWIPASKTPNGITEVPRTSIAIEAFKSQMAKGRFCFRAIRIRAGIKRGSTLCGKRLSTSKGSLLSDLRSSFHLCRAAERRRRSR